jgi:hypothetical protein
VDDFLFYTTCTTCQARLMVRSEAAIGQILACPKCESMVQVVPPPDWKPKGEADQSDVQPEDRRSDELPEAEKGCQGRLVGPCPSSGADKPPPPPGGAENAKPGQPEAPSRRRKAAAPPPLPPIPAGAPAGLSSAMAPAEALWRKWLVLAAAPAAAAVLAIGVWSMWPGGSDVPAPVVVAPSDPAPPADSAPAAEEPQPPAPARLDRRWLPSGAQMLFSLRPRELAGLEELGLSLSLAEPTWQSGVRRLIDAFGLRLAGIERLTWASTDLAGWPDNSVVLIELAEDQDAGMLRVLGEPLDLKVAGVACRRPKDSAWGHPFAILDQRTLITGREELLRQLAERSEPGGMSPAVERFLNSTATQGDLLMAVDLAAARQAGWRLPNWQMDVWPAGRNAWHAIWELPRGLGMTFRRGDRVFSELALVCEGETTANQVRDALAELIPAAKDALTARADSLTKQLKAGRIDADTADRYELVLDEGRAALAASQWEVVDETVWGRVDWGPKLSALADALVKGRRAIRADWLDAARALDEANAERILSGLGGYAKAEGHFPVGAGGGALLPPETRLSWIATMLPYYDHRDWHRELEFGYSWNSPQNRPVTRRPLEAVVNPALGPSANEAGFPVTHYVGVAGLGTDAGELPADSPRAGMFGFNRTSRPEDVPDGLSNTVAVLGVCGRLGAWGSGGDPTVRGLTQRPYVNGPDGFGSGQPDGMLVGMADGSVRFVSKDVDPQAFEQLVTIGGQEKATVAVLGPPKTEPPGPQEPPLEGDSPIFAARKSGQSPPPQEPAEPQEPPAVAAEPKPELPKVDVDVQLAARVGGLTLPGVPLADSVRLLGQLAGLPIAYDLDNMAVLGVSLEDPVTVRLPAGTIGEVLRKVLASRGLVYVVQDGHLLVTGPEGRRNQLSPVGYAVSDLAGVDPEGLDELAEVVRTMVAPDTWRPAGGRGTIAAAGGALAVTQTAPVHREVLTLCDNLRLARGIPVQGSHGEPFGLASRLARARATLQRPVTTTFHEPAALERVAEELASTSGTRIVVDWPALAAEGVPPTVAGSVRVDGQPLSAALDELLQPLGLAYRVVEPDVFEITTRKELAARLEVELYPVGPLMTAKGMTAESLAEWIKGRVAGGSWNDAGGPGAAYFDGPSRTLVVLQSQPIQGQIEAALAAAAQDGRQ